MEKDDSKEEIYEDAKNKHAFLDRRLQMLLKKPYLTEEEEMEIKILKKKKLYYKDLMEKTKEEIERGEKG
ncbi:MAG TPA: hypothetical protein PLW88_01500 [Syntrophorhabdaceae bacterium]|nr:hypothetical protein [Syntrophorhabdaceae bacterium]HPP06016.1 hypothetical protein [Syntrophorhabdaceae bacterium]